MAIRLEKWENPKEVLKAKLDRDRLYRKTDVEPEWIICESALENAGFNNPDIDGGGNPQVLPGHEGNGGDGIRPNAGYIFQHYRLLHSQLSSNPPVVGARPLSMDQIDLDSADAAEDVNRYWFQHANLQENVDQATGKTLKYGTGYLKTIYDPNLGDMLDFDEAEEIVTMEGDAAVYSPSTWDVWIDSSARRLEDVEHQWERIWNSYEYWTSVFTEDWQIAVLDSILETKKEQAQAQGLDEFGSDIPLYYYYEKGMPRNAMLGRFAIITEEGELLTDGIKPNPHFYRPAKSREERQAYLEARKGVTGLKKKSPIAKLPIHILTDIDVDDRVYGRSFIYYEANNQDIINRLDEVTLNNVKAHGAQKIVVTGTGTLEADAISDDQFVALRLNGAGDVHALNRPGSMPDMTALRGILQDAGDRTAAVNDAMVGKVDRETSASALQIAASQGNQVKRRLFVKYTAFCECVYRSLNMISREHWEEGKVIEVLGSQGAYKRRHVKALDIDGGYAFYSAYGEQFSLDPAMRRQEIQQVLAPLMETGAITPQQYVGLMGINEVEIAQDMAKLGELRQKAIFEEIKASGKQIQPDPDIEDSDAMLAWARFYVMTAEYHSLDPKSKALIREHIKLRMQIIAQQAPQMPQMEQGPIQATPNQPPMLG